MTEEIIMFNKSDVESLEEAIKRLEQENKELKSQASLYENLYNHHGELVTDYRKQRGRAILYKSFLEELLYLLKTEEPFCYCSCGDEIIDRINEVLND